MIPLYDDNPTELRPWFTVSFLALCIGAFVWQLSLGKAGDQAILALGVIPARLLQHGQLIPDLAIIPAWATMFTSMFLHGGWLHLIGNLLYLWIFGNNVEDAMGHVRFVLFYFICGVAAVFAQALPDPQSIVPMIGASGAISGVLGAYLMLYPHARVLVLVPIWIVPYTFHLRAGIVLAIWFVWQLVSSWLTGDQQSGVAFGAHIGGFVAGVALVGLFKRSDVPLFAPARPGDWDEPAVETKED